MRKAPFAWSKRSHLLLLPMLMAGSGCGGVNELLLPDAMNWRVVLVNRSNALGQFDPVQGKRAAVSLHMMVEQEGEQVPCCVVPLGGSRSVIVRAFEGDALWLRATAQGGTASERNACVLVRDGDTHDPVYVEIAYDQDNPRPGGGDIRCYEGATEPFTAPSGAAHPY